MAYARRVDANHGDVVDTLRRRGWHVWDSARVGGGWFDAVAVKHGRVAFIEIKDGSKPPSARKLTEDEAEMHESFLRHGAEVVILSSVEEAVRL